MAETGDETPDRAEPLKPLKPCPFCGVAAEVAEAAARSYFVRCTNWQRCWSSGPARATDAEAAEAWNAAPRLVDGLEPEPPAWVKDLTAKLDAVLAAPPKKASRPDLTIAEAALLVGVTAEKARTNCHLAKKGKGDWAGVKVRREGRRWRIEAASFDRLRGAS